MAFPITRSPSPNDAQLKSKVKLPLRSSPLFQSPGRPCRSRPLATRGPASCTKSGKRPQTQRVTMIASSVGESDVMAHKERSPSSSPASSWRRTNRWKEAQNTPSPFRHNIHTHARTHARTTTAVFSVGAETNGSSKLVGTTTQEEGRHNRNI